MSADLETRLRSLLGLNKYQASAYLALLRGGPMKPQEVAKAAGVPLQRIYDTLRSLVDMGLVAESEGGYEAVNPEEALELIAKREVARAIDRAQEIERLSHELAAGLRQGSAAPLVTLIRGLESVMGAALASVSRCRDRPIFMTYRVFERLDQLVPLLRALASASGPGAIVVVPRGYLEKFPQYKAEFEAIGLSFRESEASFIDLMVACDTVLVGVPYLSDVVAVMVRDREFAQGLRRGIERAVGL